MSIDPISLGITLALTAANMALTASRKIEGPRLDDLKFTSGDYGAPINRIWGMRREQPPIFFAEDLKEVKRRRKTKGGKFNEYTYFGTWAVALADHEIAGIRRIWFDTHLVFDLSGAGPVTPFDFGDRGIVKDPDMPFGIGFGGTNYGDAVALYLGTETQEPDPRMQATIEARHGEGTCPAYRGLAYLVFKDIPLEKLGNRIPQVSVEVLGTATIYMPTETKDLVQGPSSNFDIVFSRDYSRLSLVNGAYYEIWDVAARSLMISGTMAEYVVGNSQFGVYNDGSLLVVTHLHDLVRISPGGGEATILSSINAMGVMVVADGNGVEHYGTIPFSGLTSFFFDGTEYNFGWQVQMYFTDSHGNVWAVGSDQPGSSNCYFVRLVTIDPAGYLGAFTVVMPSAFDAPEAIAAGEAFLMAWDGDLYLVDPTTGTRGSATASPTFYTTANWVNAILGSQSIWLGSSEYEVTSGTLIRTVAGVPGDTGLMVYDPVNHAIIVFNNVTFEATWYYIDRVTSDGVPLAQIAGDVADLCGVSDYDFSSLDQTITGWSTTQGDGSNMIEPLLDAYDSDIRPHDFTVQGVKRSGVATGTLDVAWFVKQEPRYSVTIRQARELPRAITVNFADTEGDQQPNNVRADRPLDATDAKADETIDLSTLALDPDDARPLADRYFRRLWNGRKEPSLALTAKAIGLEPGDVKTLSLDGETMTAQLRRMTVKADDSIETEWRYDHPSLATLDGAGGAAFDGRNPSVVIVPLISKGFVLDIPLLTDSDSDANPLLYTAAAPYASGTWPGATIYQATGGEYSDEFASIPSNASATWGYATDVLPSANPWLWDRGNSVNVQMQVGTLTGCTEADIDADPMMNLCLLGDELLNFTTATLEGDGSYTLSGLKRGRRGTEWACAGHAVNDTFVLLDTADAVELGLSDVGTDLSFKAATNGRTTTGAFPIDLTFDGNSLKPYAPADLRAEKQDNGDWVISWKWRTRVGGDWRSGVAPSSAEASLSFHVTLSDGVTEVTKTASASPYTWDVATQTTDTGAEVAEGDLSASVAQISATVGDGWETAIAA